MISEIPPGGLLGGQYAGRVKSFLIDKADELFVHNRKGVGNQKEKGGGVL